MNEFDLSYFMFAEQQILQQSSIMSNLSECVALESGDIESLRAISEGAIDKIKEVLHKIAEKIKEVFKKFTTRVSELVISDQKFLEKYKDVILNNSFKDKKVTMYNYDVNKLSNGFLIPNYNWNEIEKICMAENVEAEVINTYYKDLKADSNDTLAEQMTKAIKGEEEVEMSLRSLDPKELYNFCVNFKKNTEVIDKAQEDVNKMINSISIELEKAYKEVESRAPQQSQDNSQQQTQQSQDNSQQQTQQQQESAYSSVYGTIVTEAPKFEKEKSSNTSNSNTKGTATVKTGGEEIKNLQQDKISRDINDNVSGKVSVNGNDNENNKETSEKLEKLKTNVTKYSQTITSVLTTKMNLLMSAYKDYMYILKDHVKEYAGSTDGTADTLDNGDAPEQKKYGVFTFNDKEAKIEYQPDVTRAAKLTNNNKYVIASGNTAYKLDYNANVDEEISKVANNLAKKVPVDTSKPVAMSLKNCDDLKFIISINGKWVKANKGNFSKTDKEGNVKERTFKPITVEDMEKILNSKEPFTL